MRKIYYKDTSYNCKDGELLLDAFLRQGVNVPFSCRSGSCHVCMARCTGGEIPEAAQRGVNEKLKNLDYFLPCKCVPTSDMCVAEANRADLFVDGIVIKKELLARDICRLFIETATVIEYQAGQFVNLRGADKNLVRSYSLASLPDEDFYLELHIKRRENGAFSNWVFDELQEGDGIEVQGPIGDFSYDYAAIFDDAAMLMIATGTGLAPVLGVLRDALANGHRGPIHLYHGSSLAEGLYLHEHLNKLAQEYPNFIYHPCVSGDHVPKGYRAGRATDLAITDHPNLESWTVFLAGLPKMVAIGESAARAAGAAQILSDAFELKELRDQAGISPAIHPGRRQNDTDNKPVAGNPETSYPAPDLELWQVLENGQLLIKILREFYKRVFKDSLLSPFFTRVTQSHIAEKQYLFLRQLITGEKVFFGDRPRNAHHWMAISDELFDYREALMLDVIRGHGVPEEFVQRWLRIEAVFREDIVKDKPHGKIIDGVEMPFEGFEEVNLDIGTLCDSCQSEINPGTRVRYHIRMGTTYCPNCMNDEAMPDSTIAATRDA
jgi:NAD(P)H-flavin reductase/ferredoxin/truncated hemoglobin YjbI